MIKVKIHILIVMGILLMTVPALARDMKNLPMHTVPVAVDSGVHDGSGEGTVMVFEKEIRISGALWLRVKVSEYELGSGSYIKFISLKDGGAQRLDSTTLPQWGSTSAYFNGDGVRVELHVAPGDSGIFVRIEDVIVGDDPKLTSFPVAESICGTDNRVASAEARAGRLTFVFANGNPNNACSAWLVSNGAILTAGHCVDFDPDGNGAGLPDGVLDLDNNDVLEFNVPNSLASGALVFANPNDQYAINLNSVVWHYDGENQGLGKDYAAFSVFPNANTGLTPHQARGFYRMTNYGPGAGATIRVTGYGTDTGTTNQIQQTHTGPYVSESSSGANFWHSYSVDTTGGSSGSPVIWEVNGFTIGIHTNGGCNADGTGSNSGTSFEHDPLETALENFPGANTVYTDAIRYGALMNGTVFHPYDTVTSSVTTATDGAIISIVEGSYNETMVISKPLTLTAPVGEVVIGQ